MAARLHHNVHFPDLGLRCLTEQVFDSSKIFSNSILDIFEGFGFTSVTQTLLATGVTGILQIIFTLPTVLFLDSFGRKTFMIVGAIGMCICHVIVAAM